jgi:hypothetical protein
MIQIGGNILRSEIHKLLNIWNKEELPQQWKESTIVHIYKNGDGNGVVITNYILPSMFVSRLTPYIVEVVGDHQCGFQRNTSTTYLISCIHQILNKQWENNSKVHQLFTNFKKFL